MPGASPELEEASCSLAQLCWRLLHPRNVREENSVVLKSPVLPNLFQQPQKTSTSFPAGSPDVHLPKQGQASAAVRLQGSACHPVGSTKSSVCGGRTVESCSPCTPGRPEYSGSYHAPLSLNHLGSGHHWVSSGLSCITDHGGMTLGKWSWRLC